MSSRRAPQAVDETVGLLTSLIRHARLVWRLMLDQRMPFAVKLIMPGALAYILLPLDFVPDIFLGLGGLDDLAILVIALKLFLALCPPALVQQHAGDIAHNRPRRRTDRPTTVINGEYSIRENKVQ